MEEGDHEARGDDMERKADKKLSGWGLFGSQYDAAADLYYGAATFFKLAKSWSRAASVYTKIASCHLKLDSKNEAASAYADAANCYKKFSPHEAARALDQAVVLFLEVGRLAMAARYCKDAGVIYQQEKDLAMASDYLERAADLFDVEGHTSQSNVIKHEIAEIAAQLGRYPKAAQIFEEIARQSIKSKLLKYSVRAVLVNAGICQLCIDDGVAMQKSLARYQDIDPTFSGTREHKLLADLAASMDDGDVARFTAAIEKFDGITRLDPWRTMLLLRAKDEVKKHEEEEEEEEEDDLT